MSDRHEMTYGEFVDLGTDLINRIMDRIPERWRGGFTTDIEDGIQWPEFFLRNLVLLLDREQLPITTEERDMAVRLMKDEGMDLAPVDRFNVTDTPGTTAPR